MTPIWGSHSFPFERSYEKRSMLFQRSPSGTLPVPERTRYDEKLARILREAAVVFSQKGYHRASVRDIAAATGISLSGLYYYFESKEELLFLIQEHCFDTIVAKLEDDLASTGSAREGVEVVIRNHLSFFVATLALFSMMDWIYKPVPPSGGSDHSPEPITFTRPKSGLPPTPKEVAACLTRFLSGTRRRTESYSSSSTIPPQTHIRMR